MDAVLVVNAGSSSLKFAVDRPGARPPDRADACELGPAGARSDAPQAFQRAFHGHVARADEGLVLSVQNAAGETVHRTQLPSPGDAFDHDLALGSVLHWLDAQQPALRPTAVGHRVVHGGEAHTAPALVTDAVLADLEALVPLAPLHQPHNLAPIAAVQRHWPGVPQVVCFDTAFHATQSPTVRAYALPRHLSQAGVRRYGFHGLSYEYVAGRLPELLGPVGAGRVIVAHLGNGASLCAMVDCKSVASTMGFSALDGLVMATRCGSLDAGVVLYLLQHERLDAARVSELLYVQSGLLGVSGISGDMAVLLASTDARAGEAIALFVHRTVVEIGGLVAVMGGLDALVFTGGIGEHAAPIRARIAAGCGWLGAVIDHAANDGADPSLIHAAHSRVQLAVVPTDEERMLAEHTWRLTRPQPPAGA